MAVSISPALPTDAVETLTDNDVPDKVQRFIEEQDSEAQAEILPAIQALSAEGPALREPSVGKR